MRCSRDSASSSVFFGLGSRTSSTSIATSSATMGSASAESKTAAGTATAVGPIGGHGNPNPMSCALIAGVTSTLGRVDEQDHRPTVTVEDARGMDLAPVRYHRMVTNVQRLFCAIETQSAAHIVTQPHGNGWGVPTRLLSVCGALIVLWLIWIDVKHILSTALW